MQFLKKQLVSLSVRFRIQERKSKKEKQNIHFTNAYAKNEKV